MSTKWTIIIFFGSVVVQYGLFLRLLLRFLFNNLKKKKKNGGEVSRVIHIPTKSFSFVLDTHLNGYRAVVNQWKSLLIKVSMLKSNI